MEKPATFKRRPSELLRHAGYYVCSGVLVEILPYSEMLNLVQVVDKVTGRREFGFNMKAAVTDQSS
jgi:hypothetical protein